MDSRERFQARTNDLQEQWELLREKISGLERDRILETRSEEGLRLDENISALKERRQAVEEELTAAEEQLQAVDSDVGTGWLVRFQGTGKAFFRLLQKQPQKRAVWR